VERAIEYHEQALTIHRETGGRHAEVIELNNLANAYSNLNQIAQAITYYQQALTISRDIGNQRGEGNALGNLGKAYKDQGNTSLARQYLMQALAIFEAIKSPDAAESHKLLAELESSDQEPVVPSVD
jgi:tetratricopeptide (TPR) repeat protein